MKYLEDQKKMWELYEEGLAPAPPPVDQIQEIKIIRNPKTGEYKYSWADQRGMKEGQKFYDRGNFSTLFKDLSKDID